MTYETERKFLVKEDMILSVLSRASRCQRIQMRQGYLSVATPTVRVRISTNEKGDSFCDETDAQEYVKRVTR